ncbi:MAG: acyl carrier protein [Acidobacteriota bacterium]
MNKEDIFKIIVGHICDVIPELQSHKFDYSDKLSELGANSVDRAEIITLTIESISLHTSLVDMAGAKNLGELVNIFYEKLCLTKY